MEVMAGDDGSFTGTYVFTNGQESDKSHCCAGAWMKPRSA
jgi:hypothetical protein